MRLQYKIDDRPYSPAGAIRTGSQNVAKPSSGGRFPTVMEEADEFSEYEMYDFPDWDAAGAEPITADTVMTARRLRKLLPRTASRADIAIGSDGTIGFEWRTGLGPERTIIFVEVGPGNRVRASLFDPHSAAKIWPWAPLEKGVYLWLNDLFPAYEPA